MCFAIVNFFLSNAILNYFVANTNVHSESLNSYILLPLQSFSMPKCFEVNKLQTKGDVYELTFSAVHAISPVLTE